MYTISAPLLKLLDSGLELIPLAFLGPQLADYRFGDLLASIILWANSTHLTDSVFFWSILTNTNVYLHLYLYPLFSLLKRILILFIEILISCVLQGNFFFLCKAGSHLAFYDTELRVTGEEYKKARKLRLVEESRGICIKKKRMGVYIHIYIYVYTRMRKRRKQKFCLFSLL